MSSSFLRSLLPPAAVALALLGGAGCGPRYALGVPKYVMEKLPYETRIELLEAENDLAAAVDRLDEAHNEVLRTRDMLRRSKDRKNAAYDERGAARDELSREIARLAIDEAEARVEYLRARQEVNVKNEEIEELSLRCAYARFEVARLGVARKAKIEGSERLKPEDFDKQVKACDAEVAELKKALAERTKKSDGSKATWETKKTELAKKTFDARASPYVE